MKVKSAMHHGLVAVKWDLPLSEVAGKMRDHNIGAVPVLKDKILVGIVTDRDVCCRGLGSSGNASGATAMDVMSKPVQVCHEEDELNHAVELMREFNVRRLPVFDRNEKLSGMLSLDDLATNVGMIVSGNALRTLAIHD